MKNEYQAQGNENVLDKQKAIRFAPTIFTTQIFSRNFHSHMNLDFAHKVEPSFYLKICVSWSWKHYCDWGKRAGTNAALRNGESQYYSYRVKKRYHDHILPSFMCKRKAPFSTKKRECHVYKNGKPKSWWKTVFRYYGHARLLEEYSSLPVTYTAMRCGSYQNYLYTVEGRFLRRDGPALFRKLRPPRFRNKKAPLLKESDTYGILENSFCYSSVGEH